MFLYNTQGALVETFAEMVIDKDCTNEPCFEMRCSDKGMFYTGRTNMFQGSKTLYCAEMKQLPYHTLGSGNDLMMIKKTPYECKKLCAINPDCKAVTWKNENECLLKTRASTFKYDPEYNTAVKFT